MFDRLIARASEGDDDPLWKEIAALRREVATLRREVEASRPHKVVAMKRPDANEPMMIITSKKQHQAFLAGQTDLRNDIAEQLIEQLSAASGRTSTGARRACCQDSSRQSEV